jgi:hypothetical protein
MPSVTYNPLMQNVVMLNVVMVSVVMLSVVAPVTGTLLALSSHIRLAWKKNVGDNYSRLFYSKEESFKTVAPGVNVMKLFFFAADDRAK